MKCRPSPLISICKSAMVGLSRIVVMGLVLVCLTVQGTGVNLLIGTFVRSSPEEASEESTCETAIRGVLHKCSRVRLVSTRLVSFLQAGMCQADGIVHTPRQSTELLAPHLVGAGINIRC